MDASSRNAPIAEIVFRVVKPPLGGWSACRRGIPPAPGQCWSRNVVWRPTQVSQVGIGQPGVVGLRCWPALRGRAFGFRSGQVCHRAETVVTSGADGMRAAANEAACPYPGANLSRSRW